ncbi:flagellin [Pseudorhizobium flavum]|uniref:Flagellin n=1 Tax=Pseudorhizobium flavum TaxID=1335061 RepID=A0A7X0DCK1_9HYPH|nr:flagellin [Pseudorhizobium flavum]MBB6179988.1 flagellin-like hook-associated protein FlgL [Pseudorhizobium flavum]CAD6598724.1 flagellin [Pseudorhizobium flavum]
MTSIHTNVGAISALQTLRSISSQMGEAQRQVSIGLRVGAASDNSAYWSIATTMRSDNMALSAVQDALGLGAATVDTAYAGTSSIVDILTEFKARLVAAKEEGLDKAKVQQELAQLNAQAESIVRSSSFSGTNWLATTSPAHLMETDAIPAAVVASFVRSSSGSVSVEKLDMNLKTTSMLNTGGGGILQKEIGGVGDIGGFRGSELTADAHQGHESHTFTGPTIFGASDYIEFDLIIDASPHSPGDTFTGLRIDKAVIDAALGTTEGVMLNAAQLRTVLNRVFSDNSVPASASATLFTGGMAGLFEIESTESTTHPGSSIDVLNVTSEFGGVPGTFGMGLEDVPVRNHDNMYPEEQITFTEPFTMSEKAEIYFDMQIGPGPVTTYRIDRTTVSAALGTSDGYVGSASDLAAVIGYVTSGAGLLTTAVGSSILFTADQTVFPEAGNKAARFYVGNVWSVPLWTLDFDFAEVDITTSAFTVDEYITGVEYMLKHAISSASTLGSIAMRIDMQSDFVASLTDSITSGIGRLVDADMNEASTRLKALQTQEQLATQSLSIANANAEAILTLFR